MPQLAIRTVNTFFVSTADYLDYVDEIQARNAAFQAAGDVAFTDFLAGERASTVLGEVLDDTGKVVQRVAVSISATDMAIV